jgi:hypothetical protein
MDGVPHENHSISTQRCTCVFRILDDFIACEIAFPLVQMIWCKTARFSENKVQSAN